MRMAKYWLRHFISIAEKESVKMTKNGIGKRKYSVKLFNNHCVNHTKITRFYDFRRVISVQLRNDFSILAVNDSTLPPPPPPPPVWPKCKDRDRAIPPAVETCDGWKEKTQETLSAIAPAGGQVSSSPVKLHGSSEAGLV